MDEYELVKSCIKGKPEAQKLLYDRFSSVMLSVCYRYTKSMADAEDILQEGFIKVFYNIHQFKFAGELGAWIRRIMVTTSINYLKRNERYQSELLFTDDPLHIVNNQYDPEVTLNAKELADLIRQLPPGYQAIFNLYAVEGFNHGEIGKILGIKEATSRSQYARARALLIQWMEKNNDLKRTSYAK
ncbi:MAG TPA: RNA polymerase sigma factor [Flavisolibacter sp.]|nr:RNA polymerase sigma factor [Flavisolibacter sp.]